MGWRRGRGAGRDQCRWRGVWDLDLTSVGLEVRRELAVAVFGSDCRRGGSKARGARMRSAFLGLFLATDARHRCDPLPPRSLHPSTPLATGLLLSSRISLPGHATFATDSTASRPG